MANLDPAVANEPESAMATLAVYENLVRYKGSTTEVEGRLAKSWEVSADGKVYTFKLYDNIKFQDGTVCDAAAVKFSLERMIKMNKGPAKILAAVDTIDAVDAVTVRFNLKYSYPAFLYELCNHMGVQIVSPKAVKDNATADDPYAAKWFAKNMVGTGPYKLEKWAVGRPISLVKNESYW